MADSATKTAVCGAQKTSIALKRAAIRTESFSRRVKEKLG